MSYASRFRPVFFVLFAFAFAFARISSAQEQAAQEQPTTKPAGPRNRAAVVERDLRLEDWSTVRNEVVRRNEFEAEKHKRQMAETKERAKERARQEKAFDEYQQKETDVIAALAKEVEALRAANDKEKLAEREKELNRHRRELSDRTIEWQRDQRWINRRKGTIAFVLGAHSRTRHPGHF